MPVRTDMFQRLTIEGGGLEKMNNIGSERLILGANMSLAVDQAGELSFDLNDPNWAFISSFNNDRGPINKKALYGADMPLFVSSFSLSGGPSGLGGTTLKLQPGGIGRARNIKGALNRQNISPTQYAKDAAAHCGMKFFGEDSPKRPSITRDVASSEDKTAEANEWTTLKRLAGEEGFLLFECLNTLYFATPQYLFDKRPTITVGWGTAVADDQLRLLNLPSIDMSTSVKTDDEISFDLPIEGAGRIVPGNGLIVKGIFRGMSDKKLLVTSVDYPLAGTGVVSVRAKYPWKIEKTPPPGTGGGGGGGISLVGGAGPVLTHATGPRVNGLTPATNQLKHLISQKFNIPLGNIGGYRPEDGYGEHSSGRALDVMTYADSAKGTAVKNYVVQNAKNFGLKWAIWQQRLWYPGGSSQGMENRGSPTQNHMDHVHIFINR